MATLQSAHYVDEDTLTVSSSSVGLASSFTAAQLAESDFALVYVHSADVYYRLSGAAATATTASHKKAQDSEFTLVGRSQIENFRAIRAASTDATLKVTLFKY